MKTYPLVLISALATAIQGCGIYSGMDSPPDQAAKQKMKPPFGQPADVSYSQDLWASLSRAGLVGTNSVKQAYKGTHPHGAILDTLESTATVNGHSGEVIVKKNYGGEDVSVGNVTRNPSAYLKSITVMYQREAGYDPDNQNWFWVKYKPDSNLHTNPKGMKLAGRVAKGMGQGCIACHSAAPGGDYRFLETGR